MTYTLLIDILEPTDDGEEWYTFSDDNEREAEAPVTPEWATREAVAIIRDEDGSFGDYCVTVRDSDGTTIVDGHEFVYTGADLRA